jgi:hypothetical protein
MRFQNIRVGDEVSLDRVEKQPDGSVVTINLKNPAKPLASFQAAMQAFSGYAVELIGAPHWHEDAKVTSIHLSEEPKTNRRGLIVTFTRKIERAKNRVVVVNTPLQHAPVDDQEGTNPGTFPREVAEMIATVEDEATKYWKGEREQAEMFPEGQAAGTRDDAPAPTKARGKKNRDFIPGVGPVVNPDATEQLTDENLRQLLLRVERDVPIDALARWTSGERDAAQRWATALIEAKLNGRPYEGAEPKSVKRDATPALADGWTQESPPPKAADVHPVTAG